MALALLVCGALGLWLSVARPIEAAAAPTFSAVAPALGTRDGGTLLTLTGTGFIVGATVTVGGTPAVGVAVPNPTTITATTPVGTPGNAVIVVTNPDGQSATLSGAFTYQAWAPTVGSVVAASGTSLGGTSVTITGTNFAAGATAKFGGTLATGVVVNSATSITAVTPPHTAGLVDVVVTNLDTQLGTLAASFTYVAAPSPTVTSASPNTGTTGGGTPVTITGSNFASGATVTFGGTAAASVVFNSATEIIATTPAKAAGAVAIIVANKDTQTGTLANGFTYVATPAPTVTSLSPKEGSFAGSSVTITGTGFLAGATVTFGGTAATGVSVSSPTSITATAPPKTTAGAVDVAVKNTDNQTGTLTAGYTYLDKPTFTSVTPSAGPAAGGTVVKIAGAAFGTAPTVKFGATAASSVTVSSATELMVTTPAGTGVVDVTVTGPGGDTIKTAAFTYTSGSLALTAATPLEGSTAGGTAVTLTGTGFTSGATVLFADSAGTGVTVSSDGKTITVTAPARAAGNATISVKLTDGQTVSLSTPFVYTAAAAPGLILSGKIAAGSIALVVFSGGTTDQLVTAATGATNCPTKERLIFAALVQSTWVVLIPAAPKQVNAAWNQQFGSGLPQRSALFVRCS